MKEQFNIPVVNVIWRMVASKTFPLKSEEGMKTFFSKHVQGGSKKMSHKEFSLESVLGGRF